MGDVEAVAVGGRHNHCRAGRDDECRDLCVVAVSITETSAPQNVFQSQLCVEREAAANAAQAQGIRVVNLRIGLVLGRDGGIFQQLARPAKLGGAAAIGAGQQWMSWIHINDMLRIIERAIDDPALRGPINAVAPDVAAHSGAGFATGAG